VFITAEATMVPHTLVLQVWAGNLMKAWPDRHRAPRQSHESTKFGRDGLPLSYGQFDQSASADP